MSSSAVRFLAPRFWVMWLLVGWLRAVAMLPWQRSVALHRHIGRALWYLLPGRRAVVLRNLEICLPELDARRRTATARRTFENVAISVAEIAAAWFSETLPPVRIEGREHLDVALARGRGAILCSGHFTTLELTTQFLKPLAPKFAFMFRARSNPLLDAVQTRGRRRTADLSFSNADGRAMLKALRDNAAVWYAPDQVYQGRGAELLPFFGEPAMTTTATSRLARISGAPVLPCHFQRLSREEAGYLVRIERPVAGIPSDDAIADTRVINATLERSIRECPEQYLWTHRRFRARGSSLPDAYAAEKAQGTAWRRAILATGVIVAVIAAFIASAQPPSKHEPELLEAGPMRIERVKDGLYLIRGPFLPCTPNGCRPNGPDDGLYHEPGDVALRVTSRGLILVDDKFTNHVPNVIELVRRVSDLPIRYVLNTHHHGDHASGNATLRAMGIDVVGHENVRANFLRIAQPGEPNIAFADKASVFVGGVEVQLLHLGSGHTSGDTVIYFPDLKTVHAGDLIVDGMPVIDYDGGGSAVQFVKTIEALLRIDFDTLIPGHGRLMTKQEVADYKARFEEMNRRMRALARSGVPKNEARAKLYLADLGWDRTVSTTTWERNLERYYDEMAAR